jgi:hypothetical protein
MIVKTKNEIYCKCNQCGHKWSPRGPANKVKICPSLGCHSLHWNEVKRKKKAGK